MLMYGIGISFPIIGLKSLYSDKIGCQDIDEKMPAEEENPEGVEGKAAQGGEEGHCAREVHVPVEHRRLGGGICDGNIGNIGGMVKYGEVERKVIMQERFTFQWNIAA